MTLSLFDYRPPSASPSAPEGVRRAARAGSRVDSAVLSVAAENVGREVTEADFWCYVCARVTCAPDTARRRRDALRDEGHLAYRRPATGVIVVEWVKAP